MIDNRYMRPTMIIRWSKKVYHDGSIGSMIRVLQQKWVNGAGEVKWVEIETEQ